MPNTRKGDMMETGPISSYRLVLIAVRPWWRTPGWLLSWVRDHTPIGHTWQDKLRILYGMDIWIGRVPLVRTIAVAHLVLWAWRAIA